MTGVKQLGAARASLFMNLLPVLVAIGAWVLLDEQLHLYHAVGAATTLLGVVVALRQGGAAKSCCAAKRADWQKVIRVSYRASA